jgi:hypothetical protein
VADVTPAVDPATPVQTPLLKALVLLATSPQGKAAIFGIAGLGGPISAAAGLLLDFGVTILGPMLATWGEPTITRADLDAHILAKGGKVEVFDPATMFG